MDPVFEVNPFLAQGAAKEVYEKLFKMLQGVVHMAFFGCAAMGAACGRPPGLSYIFYRRHY